MDQISPELLFNFLSENGINFYTGIPDSLLKEFNNVITHKSSKENHIIPSNEGSSIALATGYYLSTKKIPIVYMQNSGFGNGVNPLMSLASPGVYSIPMIIFVGWRGEPGIADEPQHMTQGGCMVELITSLGINMDILPQNQSDADALLKNIIEKVTLNLSPHIILVKKNTFSKYYNPTLITNTYELYRKETIDITYGMFSNDIILSTTGKISRELLENTLEHKSSTNNIFMNVGAMGHVSMIGLGIAKNTTKRVVCFDGDGSVLMHMGNLATIGSSGVSNMVHIVLNNGMHESVGSQKTDAFDINLAKIAKYNGYENSFCVKKRDDLIDLLNLIRSNEITGLIFIEIRINNSQQYSHELMRPQDTPVERKDKFMEFIES